MRLDRLDVGEKLTLQLRALTDLPDPAPAIADEVRLVAPKDSDETLLGWGDVLVEVEPSTDGSRRSLAVLRQQDPPRLCWVAAVDTRGDTVLTVVVHRLRTHYRWEQGLRLGVDDRILERLGKLEGRIVSVDDARDWLAERLLLPPLRVGDLPRVVATGAPGGRRRFRLLGPGIGVDIVDREGRLLVERVVQTRAHRQGFRPPEFLLEASVEFVDATVATGALPSIRAQIEQIVAESDTSYLALWQRYQDIEQEQLRQQARELGWLEYTAWKALPNGCWSFVARNDRALRDFTSGMRSDEQELEIGAQPPPELLDQPDQETPRGDERAFVGRIDSIRWDRKELHLRPLDEDIDVVIPSKGCVFGALTGDRVRLRRREEAVQRLKAADARMPQLALIIEGRDAPVRRIDQAEHLTQAAREVFFSEPTPAQRRAVDVVLNTPDIALIQGPPGTGKTTVLAAIERRLAELEAEQPGIAGRTLLTSFQHDAVDNAADRTLVFGLPPARFGGKRGRDTVGEQARRWAEEARGKVLARLSVRQEERPRALHAQIRDRVAIHASGELSDDDTRALLEELRVLPAGTLSQGLLERISGLRAPGSVETSGGLDRQLANKAARGIRSTEASFSDDGPYRAHVALERLGEHLSGLERELLLRAAEAEPEDFDGLAGLEELRVGLIDRLQPQQVPGDRRRRDPVTTEVLNRVVAELRARMVATTGGVADAMHEYADTLRHAPGEVIRTLRQYSAVFAATCQGSVGRSIGDAKETGLVFENVIIDEAARANPLDLFIPMSLASRRIGVFGDHRQLAHILEWLIEQELAEGSSEAVRKALKESLFERLFEHLKQREALDGITRVVTLDQQFRMHPVLGDFISEVFYALHEEAFSSPRPASDFVHDLATWSRDGRPICAAWKDIPLSAGKEKRAGTSRARPEEADWIAAEVRRLVEGPGAELTIGVISFYTGQTRELLRAMGEQGLAEEDPDTGEVDICARWKTLEQPDGSRTERLRVGTVDSFQGMEFDVVFLSVVRCNTVTGDDVRALRARFGHLLLANRLCVAVSRQKRLLIVVGDKTMFEDEVARRELPGLSRFIELCGGDDGLVT
jgi:hypothetical protein